MSVLVAWWLKPEEVVAVAEKVRIDGKHILLVEDTILNQKLAILVLEGRGAKVTLAQDGQEAVDIFKKCEPGTFALSLWIL